MQTECKPKLFDFEAVERRSVVAGFDGGNITSNAGALLLGQVDQVFSTTACPVASITVFGSDAPFRSVRSPLIT